MAFTKATKEQAKLRLALLGPAGSGKTYTALKLASFLGERIAVFDTEHRSASKYADEFEFDTDSPDTFHPQKYIDAIRNAADLRYDVLIIDSLTHAWAGKDGVIELVDKFTAQAQSSNRFGDGWRKATPLHNSLVETMLQVPLHLIVTMRVKMEYVQEKDERGKTHIRKVGLQPVQRDGLEYEFDVVADMDTDNNMIIGKTRCKVLKGQIFPTPGKEVANILKGWLTTGTVAEVRPLLVAPSVEQPVPPQPAQRRVDAVRQALDDEETAGLPAEPELLEGGKPVVSESEHPNRNKATIAITRTIAIAADRAGYKLDAEKHRAATDFYGRSICSFFDIGAKPADYQPFLKHLTELSLKANGGNTGG